MKMVLLGVPGVALHLNRWKDDLCESAVDELGWEVVHLPAKGIHVDDVVRQVKEGADMFMWSRTHNWNPDGDAYTMLRRIEDLGVPTVAHHMDLYFGVDKRQDMIGIDPWWSAQYVFTADGGHDKEFAAKGVNHTWCPPAMNRKWIGRGTVDAKKYPHKVAFVGSYYRQAHGVHRLELLRWARRVYGSTFQQYDGRRGRIWGPDLNDLYSTTPVMIGDSAKADYYWSDRVVHTLGRGGLLAHCAVPGLVEQGFTKDVMIHYGRMQFGSLGQSIRRLSPERRAEMSDAAMTLIEERHTWKQRLLEIQGTVFGE